MLRSSSQVVMRCVIKPRITSSSHLSFVKPPPRTPSTARPPICQRRTLTALKPRANQPPVTNSCENCSPGQIWGMERGLGLQSRLIAGVSPIAAIAGRAAAPPVGFPRLVQYSRQRWRQSRFTGGRVSVRQQVLIYFYVLPILSNRSYLTSAFPPSVTAHPLHWSRLSDKTHVEDKW